MTISFTCPSCTKSLKAPDEKAGRKVACPACKQGVVVPKPDLHDKVRATAAQVGRVATTTGKVAKATGQVADAVSHVAEAGNKVGKAVTAVAGLSAGGSTLLGGVGDFLRPLGNINLAVTVLALAATGVLFAVGRRKRLPKIRLRIKVGTVAGLCVAVVFGVWTTLGVVAGKGDKGVLAGNIPAVERAQASVLPVRQPPVAAHPGPAEEDKVGEVCRFEVEPKAYSVVQFSPDGQRLLCVACNFSRPEASNFVRVWNLQTREPLKAYDAAGVRGFAAFSADGRYILFQPAAKTPDGSYEVILWDVEAGREVRRIPASGRAMNAALSPDGSRAVASLFDGSVVLWDLRTGRPVRQFAKIGVANSAALSPDGRLAAANDFGGKEGLFVWDTATGGVVRHIAPPVNASGPGDFSRDGRLLLVGHANPNSPPFVRAWNVQTGEELGPFRGSEGLLRAVFSPDAGRILGGGRDAKVWCWDVATGRTVCQLEGHAGSISSVDCSPDGRLAVSSSTDGTVRVWRLPR